MILGSASPRRKEILSFFDLPFTQKVPNFKEDHFLFDGNPEAYVIALSEGKSFTIDCDDLVLTADTIVYKRGKLYPKPQNLSQAKLFLGELQGGWHSVYSALTLRKGAELYSQVEETKVQFNSLSAREIELYCERIHWADKAGGYAIQMAGGLIVKKINGCYYNVMGLPINTLHQLLKKFGIELWEYVR